MSLGNERQTEDLVRSHFKADASVADLRIEEQASTDSVLRSALAGASKQGHGIGKPEFLISSQVAPDLIVVVACKADVKYHETPNRDNPKDCAVDGVLHYAAALSSVRDVIAIAVSGQGAASMRVSTFRRFKGETEATELQDEHGPVTQLLSFAEYQRLRHFDPAVRQQSYADLMAYSRQLHKYMREKAKLAEAEKPLLVAAILIALQDPGFEASYGKAQSGQLAERLLSAASDVVKEAEIPEKEREVMLQPFSFIATHAVLNEVPKGEHSTPLQQMVADIDAHVRPFLVNYHDVDVLGHFYGEFLRYSGGDGKGLGIVLTPRHIGELFATLAGVEPNHTVLDICAGTGGFLIAAMAEMDRKAGADAALRERIRTRGLVGVEQRPDMFSLAASNMMLRGDGKANLYLGSCFADDIVKEILAVEHKRHERPNIGFINPPYSQKGAGLDELSFVCQMLDCLESGGTGIAIVPMSCAIKDTKDRSKAKLLERHTLVAVMSMPDELFYPVGTVTCVMVFRAHQPHVNARAATWFGYWKDDGFIKVKPDGRIDHKHTWAAIRDEWVEAFFNRVERPGHSVLKKVDAQDEWCAEAYLETDYGTLSESDFEAIVRRYALHCLEGGVPPIPADIPAAARIENDVDNEAPLEET